MKQIYVVNVDDHFNECAKDIAAFYNLKDAQKCLQDTVLKCYWHPGEEWNGVNSDSLEECMQKKCYSSEEDTVSINCLNIADS